MKKTFSFLILIWFIGCKEKKPDFTRLDWKPVDSNLSYYLSKEGDEKQKAGELSSQLLGYITKDQTRFISIPVVDSMIIVSSEQLTNVWFNNRLKHLIGKHAEGYLRVDIYKMLNFVREARIYLDDSLTKSTIDSIGSWLKNNPAVKEIKFISKEEAARIYMQQGGEDPSEIVGFNPLPSAYKIILNESYFSFEKTKEFKKKVEDTFGVTVLINNSEEIFSSFKDKKYIFQFKSL